MTNASYELVSHACIYFDFNGFKILTDPWLIGSSYYRSWWHFPKPSKTPEALQDMNLITISHEHADHFHPPSLRKFPRTIPVWIPKLFFKSMRKRLADIGFEKVVEMAHGKTYEVATGIRITNYSFRADDSIFVYEFEGQAWIHFNDCLADASLLSEIHKRHPKVHTMFKIYANAECYPYCYESEDASQLQNWDHSMIADSFLNSARMIKPQYAVPYAGFVRIFHRRANFVNPLLSQPDAILKRAVERKLGAEKIRLMFPGDRWNREKGFQLRNPSESNLENEIQEREQEIKDKMEEHYAEEAKAQPGLQKDLMLYFQKYFRKLPFILKNKLDLKIYFCPDDADFGFLIEPKLGKATVVSQAPAWDVKVLMTSFLLHKAITDLNWQGASGSYQMRIQIKKGVREREALFWMSLFLFDAGYFNFESFDWARIAGVLWARRKEFFRYFVHFMSGRFAGQHLQKKYEINVPDEEEMHANT